MKQMTMKSVLKYGAISFMILGVFGLASQATATARGSSVELMCRNKAKEIAAETYKNCVTDVKQTQVKTLRKEYESELKALKSRYEKELKKLSNGTSSDMTATKVQSTEASAKQDDLENHTDASTVEVVEIPSEQE